MAGCTVLTLAAPKEIVIYGRSGSFSNSQSPTKHHLSSRLLQFTSSVIILPIAKMQFNALASLMFLALGVSAGVVDKRSGEGVHLANCYQNSPLGEIPYSKMIYYADDAQASQNVVPSSSNQCYVTTPGGGGWKVWEGSPITCNFPTNTFFKSTIQSGAGGYSVGQYAG